MSASATVARPAESTAAIWRKATRNGAPSAAVGAPGAASTHTASLSASSTRSGAPRATPPWLCSWLAVADSSNLNSLSPSGTRSSAAVTVMVLLAWSPLNVTWPPARVAADKSAAAVVTWVMSQNTVRPAVKSGPLRVMVKVSPSASFSAIAAPPLTGAKNTACAALPLAGICTAAERCAAAPSATVPPPLPAVGLPMVTVMVSTASGAPSRAMPMAMVAVVSPAARMRLPLPGSA